MPIILISSDARPRDAEDILTVVAAPLGGISTFVTKRIRCARLARTCCLRRHYRPKGVCRVRGPRRDL